jgi:hypothetical protein
MGIRRLMSDLLPYATPAIIGQAAGPAQDEASVTNIVIDGPSLAYFIYRKLATYRALEAGTGPARLPTYAEVGKAYSFFLSELTSHGATV